ncbi:uncharacterized protein PHALS_02717 [Plasmopara halstedii]|uniref:Uncharacterized protein n=1 Tax=Plasmopara halstedii TaxID=4781 RepID=A0A0P1AVF0_PLAHL|nr:uncharacterized protein PHALS_02717 [Plasmopara halstedii]CEG46310.1 hypothetical protein PHALS_02717 [Plasmopara halstedii]|eukprot:XP_024582679.1 hypothetical protein PHALS_02717 [Plasmopara halstedii]
MVAHRLSTDILEPTSRTCLPVSTSLTHIDLGEVLETPNQEKATLAPRTQQVLAK